MGNLSLLDTIEELIESRKSTFSNSKGEVHPIYEALSALLIKCLSDEDAQKRLLKSDENDIKSILIVDSILEKLKNNEQKSKLKGLLSNNVSLEQIIEEGALYLSENKRFLDNDMLYRIDLISEKQRKYTLNKIKSIRKEYPNGIYIKKSVIEYLDKNHNKFERNKKIKYFVAGSLVFLLSIGAIIGKNYLENNCYMNIF